MEVDFMSCLSSKDKYLYNLVAGYCDGSPDPDPFYLAVELMREGYFADKDIKLVGVWAFALICKELFRVNGVINRDGKFYIVDCDGQPYSVFDSDGKFYIVDYDGQPYGPPLGRQGLTTLT
jgi:hypothetical protein